MLAIVASFCLLLGLRLVLPSRLIALLAAAGLVGVVALLTLPSTGGSILVPANAAGYVWTFAPTVISSWCWAGPGCTGAHSPPA